MRYHAFISYSHGADARLAPALQRVLHRFAKPWWKARAVSVFRDETSLALAHSLPETLTRALDASEHFILMASPLAAQSKWVAGECKWWAENKDPERMLVVLTDGEKIVWDDAARDIDWAKNTSLPPVLKGVLKHEPLYLDLRWAKQSEHFSDRDPRFLNAVAKISAALRGMSLDAIAGEEVRQHRKTRRVTYAAVSAILLLATGAAVAAVLAIRGQARAERNLAASIEAMKTFAVDFGWRLHQREAAPSHIVHDFLTQADRLFERLQTIDDSSKLRHEHARMLVVFSQMLVRRGDLEGALHQSRRMRGMAADLLAREPRNGLLSRLLVVADIVSGVVLLEMGDFAGAEAAFRSALPGAIDLSRRDRANLDWQRLPAIAYDSLGRALLGLARYEEALEAALQYLDIIRRLVDAHPNNKTIQDDLVWALTLNGRIHARTRNAHAALQNAREAVARRDAMIAREPDVPEWRRGMIHNRLDLGDAFESAGDFKAALAEFIAARNSAVSVAARDHSDVGIHFVLAKAYRRAGDMLIKQGETATALAQYRAAMAVYERWLPQLPKHKQWHDDHAATRAAMGILEQGAPPEARK